MRSPTRRSRLVTLAVIAALVPLVTCTDEPATVTAPRAEPRALAAVVAPPTASVSVPVQVPASLQWSPFNVARRLTVPPNFSVAVHARVSGARFLAAAPNGDLLVSNPGAGKIFRVAPSASGGVPTVSDWVVGLRKPHDMVFHDVAGVTYVYVAESHQITRFVYGADGSAGARQTMVTGLPDASSPELNGAYGHELKNFAIGADHALYVSIASNTNASTSDVVATPMRGAVHRYDANGANGRLFAAGLRNAEGLAFAPGTNTLWAVVNNRDQIAYPFHQDLDGNGSDDFGKVMPAYVDDHPPEEFTRVVDGGNYGWPFCNPNPNSASGLVDMPFDRDVQNNADGARLDCATATRIDRGIQAHSAPLGLLFLQGTNAPLEYREGALVAYHGSWNRTVPTGYRVAYFPWDPATGRPGPEQDLVRGWLDGGVWGRPVDVAVDAAGQIFVSDDHSGTIYKLTYGAAPPPPPPETQSVASLTLIDADTDLPIAAYDPLPNGATLDLASLPTRNLSVRANTVPATVGSVVFGYDANPVYRTESAAPYAIAGDAIVNGVPNYAPWTPTVGSHTIAATPYTGASASGTPGTTLTVGITVTDGGTPPPPPPPSAPSAPSGLVATAAGSTQIDLAWTDNASTETGFEIERCQGVDCSAFALVATVGANVTTHQSGGLAAGTTYGYRVRATRTDAPASTYSNTASATTTAAPATAPAAPTNLIATAQNHQQVNLAWTDNATNETAYDVERCQGAGCTAFALIATLGANASAYQNTGLPSGTTYVYRVRARNAAAASAYSASVTITTKAKRR